MSTEITGNVLSQYLARVGGLRLLIKKHSKNVMKALVFNCSKQESL